MSENFTQYFVYIPVLSTTRYVHRHQHETWKSWKDPEATRFIWKFRWQHSAKSWFVRGLEPITLVPAIVTSLFMTSGQSNCLQGIAIIAIQ